jgi:hypothetical protein
LSKTWNVVLVTVLGSIGSLVRSAINGRRNVDETVRRVFGEHER